MIAAIAVGPALRLYAFWGSALGTSGRGRSNRLALRRCGAKPKATPQIDVSSEERGPGRANPEEDVAAPPPPPPSPPPPPLFDHSWVRLGPLGRMGSVQVACGCSLGLAGGLGLLEPLLEPSWVLLGPCGGGSWVLLGPLTGHQHPSAELVWRLLTAWRLRNISGPV